MAGAKGRSGGARPGAGRRPVDNPTTWETYKRVAIPMPADEREEAALEWFENLEPFERLQAIIRLYYSIVK